MNKPSFSNEYGNVEEIRFGVREMSGNFVLFSLYEPWDSIMSSRYKPVNIPLNMVDYIMSSRYKPVNVPLSMVDSIMSSRNKPVNIPLNMVNTIMNSRYKEMAYIQA